MEEREELTVVTFRDLFDLIRRGLLLAIIVGVAAATAAYFLSEQLDPTYRARATLLASQPASAGSFGVTLVTAPPVDVTAYRTAATSSPVLREALERLGQATDDPAAIEEFSERINVRTESTNVSSLVHVEVEGEDPVEIAAQAQAVADSLLLWDRQRATSNLQNIVGTLEAEIAALDSQITEAGATDSVGAADQLSALQELRADRTMQLNSARALRNSAIGRLEILEPAQVPLEPVAPQPIRNAALAFVLGVFLVYGLMLLRDALDTRLRGTEDLANTSGLPVLAEFPRQPGQRRLPREAASYLRTNLLFQTASDHPKVILVTSSVSSQGKSSVALSLAESLARNEHRTLLIDADLRKPVMGKEYNLDSRIIPPLRTHLENPHEEFSPAHVAIDRNVSLDVIPSYDAAPNPSELLSQGFVSFLKRQMEQYDCIVIDSAPVLPVADTLTLAPHATGLVFAVSMADADRRSVQAALDLLGRIGVRILGTVATHVTKGQAGRGEGYGYGYGYGPDEEAAVAGTGNRRPAA